MVCFSSRSYGDADILKIINYYYKLRLLVCPKKALIDTKIVISSMVVFEIVITNYGSFR